MNELTETHYDIKKISVSNWQRQDQATELLLKITAVAANEREWMEFFLSPKLNPNAPKEIAGLLEVARGAMVYAWYFYPLSTLGAEQCCRVMETGARIRCKQAGISTNKNFTEIIKALEKQGVIQNLNLPRWEAIRGLRNSTSHPEQQMILDPFQALNLLHNCVELLNELYC